MFAQRRSFSIMTFAPLAVSALAWCAVSGGCAVYETVSETVAEALTPETPPRRIALADFARGNNQAESADAPPDTESAEPVALPGAVADATVDAPTASAAPQLLASDARRLRPGEIYIVDSLVGQINGRPIFADDFFRPIEDQLIQVRRRTGDAEFVREAERIIAARLWELVRQELFLAEAQALLKPEERQGLFAFMRYMREQTIAMGGGTQTGAQQRLQEMGEHQTIDEFVRERLDEQLIYRLLEERIRPRTIVAWRDVEREYRRRYREFNPPPTLHLARLRLTNDRKEDIERVKAMLAAGEPFEEAAQNVGQDGGVWQSFTVGEEGLHDIDISDAIKPHLKGLGVGQTTQPISVGNATMWLHLASVERTERSLYDLDVQRDLMERLTSERHRAEELRYLQSLLQKRVVGDLEVMAQRLLEIAHHRYGTQRAGSASP